MPGGTGATFLGLSSRDEERKKIQAEVDAGTYVPPARKQFGADLANASIDIARKSTGILFPNLGLSRIAATPDKAKIPVTPETLPSDITPTEAGKTPPAPAAAKPHPAAGTKDLWDYTSKLSPDKLKEFVDKNQDNPNLTGIGYVETKDPATGKMRIVPTISRPETPGINAEQLTAAGHYQQGLGMVANAKEAMEIRREGVEANKEARKEATRVREQQGEDALIKTFGQYEDASGVKDTNPSIAMFKLIDSGYDTSTLSKQWQSTANLVKAGFKEFVDAQRKAGTKATPAELKSAYYDQLRGIKGVKK